MKVVGGRSGDGARLRGVALSCGGIGGSGVGRPPRTVTGFLRANPKLRCGRRNLLPLPSPRAPGDWP